MKYIANPVIVNAFKIAKVSSMDLSVGTGGYMLMLEDGSVVVATTEMCSRMTPSTGDYWVVQADGYVCLNPKAVFERKYTLFLEQ